MLLKTIFTLSGNTTMYFLHALLLFICVGNIFKFWEKELRDRWMRLQDASQRSKQHSNILRIILLANNCCEDAKKFWKNHRFPTIFKLIIFWSRNICMEDIIFLCFNQTFYHVRFLLKAEVYSSFLQVIIPPHWKNSSGLRVVYTRILQICDFSTVHAKD